MSDYTEDTPAAPGWVEGELDGILADTLPGAAPEAARAAYLDGLAGRTGLDDVEAAHDRCRTRFLAALREAGVPEDALATLDARLLALEAELTTRT